MLIRIKNIQLLDNYVLRVSFDDNKTVIYDMKEDMDTLPNYSDLRTVKGLWYNCQLDDSRTCIYWNDYIDLASDIIYEYGIPA